MRKTTEVLLSDRDRVKIVSIIEKIKLHYRIRRVSATSEKEDMPATLMPRLLNIAVTSSALLHCFHIT